MPISLALIDATASGVVSWARSWMSRRWTAAALIAVQSTLPLPAGALAAAVWLAAAEPAAPGGFVADEPPLHAATMTTRRVVRAIRMRMAAS